MTIRTILTEPNSILRQISQSVEEVGNAERELMKDMLETMYAANGIGLAFQIIDDVLDVTASSDVLGKTAGKDLIADKTTYPKLLGLEESRKRADYLVKQAKEALAPYKGNAIPLLALADYITNRDR